jgi:hypothetical protein
MIVFDMLTWWYTTAWAQVVLGVRRRSMGVLEAFSVRLLARTLFAPFRQIDAGSVRGPIGVQLRAWFDRTFSRFFGAILRSIMIFCGVAGAAGMFVAGTLWALVWLIIPFLPLVGLLMMVVL